MAPLLPHFTVCHQVPNVDEIVKPIAESRLAHEAYHTVSSAFTGPPGPPGPPGPAGQFGQPGKYTGC